MLLTLSRLALYASLIAPIFVTRELFFPFVSFKQIYFRFFVEVSLGFFLVYLILNIFGIDEKRREETLKTLKHHLRHPVVMALMSFAALMVIASILSPNPGFSFWSNFERGDGSFQILHYVLFAVLIKILFTDKLRLTRLALVQVLTSIPISLYAIGQMLSDGTSGGFFVAAADRVSGTLGNPSYLSCYLIFNILFAAYLWINTKDLLAQIGLSLSGLLSLFLIIKAQTLGGALGLFIGLLIIGCYAIISAPHKKVRQIGLAMLGTCVGFAFIFLISRSASFWTHIPLLNRVTDISRAYENFLPRTWTWQAALRGVAERPLVGWGLENFPYAFDKSYSALHYGRESFFDRTHNVFLEYLSGGGVLGFIAWGSIFYFYYRSLRARTRSLWKGVLIAAPITYFIQGFFLFDVLAIYIPLFAFLMLVINTSKDEPELPDTMGMKKPSALNYVTSSFVGGIMILLIWISAYAPYDRNKLITRALYGSSNMFIAIAQGRQPAITVEEAINQFHESINHPSPIGKGEAIQMYSRFIADLLGRITPQTGQAAEATREQVRSLLADINAYTDNYPLATPGVKDRYFNADINIRAGIIFDIPEARTRGRENLEKDLALAPSRIELMLLIVDLAYATNDEPLYQKWRERILELRPDLKAKLPSSLKELREVRQ